MPRKSLFVSPSLWSDDELERDRRAAINRFVSSFLDSGANAYRAHYDELYPLVESLFSDTDDLTQLVHVVSELSKTELEALRFTAAPHLSQDNFKTVRDGLVEGLGLSEADAYAEIYGSLMDPIRFGWLGEGRSPSDQEREEALRWTTGLWAIQKTQTSGRTESSRRQEASVKTLLRACGYEESFATDEILLLDDLPRGCFRSESIVSGQKCDVPVRLRDGRLMLVECKVSNSSTNSTKRLIRETCGKTPGWVRSFGENVVPAVVLDGVFSLTNLKEAQNQRGLYLFWEMRLRDLTDFLIKCDA